MPQVVRLQLGSRSPRGHSLAMASLVLFGFDQTRRFGDDVATSQPSFFPTVFSLDRIWHCMCSFGSSVERAPMLATVAVLVSGFPPAFAQDASIRVTAPNRTDIAARRKR
jgi:hypothetical protein